MATWIPVAGEGEIEPGAGKQVEVGEHVVAVFNHGGRHYAIEGSCPHLGGPLGDGHLDGAGVVTCPWHAWQFRVTDGRSPLADALHVRSYPVRVEDGAICIDVDGGRGRQVAAVSETIAHHRFSIPGSGGYPLRGDVRHLQGVEEAPPIVVCHGFKGFKDWGFFPTVAEELARAGCLAVTFNLSGSGIGDDLERLDEVERFERATLSADLYDLGCVLEAVVAGRLPGPRPCAPVGLLGHSRAGGLALIRTSEDRNVGCVVTWAGVSGFDRFSAEQIEAWRRDGHLEVANARTGQVFKLRTDALDDLERHRARFDLARVVRGLAVPYLIVHGTADESVPFGEAERLRGWAPPTTTELRAIDGAGHTFGAVHPFAGRTPELDQALSATVGFIRRQLPVAAAARGG